MKNKKLILKFVALTAAAEEYASYVKPIFEEYLQEYAQGNRKQRRKRVKEFNETYSKFQKQVRGFLDNFNHLNEGQGEVLIQEMIDFLQTKLDEKYENN